MPKSTKSASQRSGLSGDGRSPEFIRRLYDLLKPPVWRYFRPVIDGLHRVPEGPALYVGNHNGGMLMPDLFIFGAALYEKFGISGLPFGLVHRTGIRLPGPRQLLVPLGGVDGTMENALGLLGSGNKVWSYPGGELELMRPYRHRDRIVFGPRRGYVRLAVAAGVPLIPFVSSGAHETLYIFDDGRWLARMLGIDRILGVKTWPILFCLPWGFWVGIPPPHLPFPSRIFIEILDPIRFDRAGEEAAGDRKYIEECHERVHGVMQEALARLSARRKSAGRDG